MKVLIVGAGIGGVTAAVALARAGHQVELHERAAALAEVGAGITLWSNALRALDALQLGESVRRRGQPLQGGLIGTREGQVLSTFRSSELTLADGRPAELYCFHRAELHAALVEGLPGGLGMVHVGRECAGVEDAGHEAVARFADGSEVRADVVVGCDGIRSAVRAALWGDTPPRYAGYVAWRGIATAPRAEGAISGEIWGRGRRFGIVPIDGERTYWFAVENADRDAAVRSPQDARAHLLEAFGGWAFGVESVLAATEPEAILRNEVLDREPILPWGRGRVTLLGDAAHPTTPNLGQGAGMAIEDALALARHLDAAEPVASLRRYEQVRHPRTRAVTLRSRRLGEMAQWEGALATRLRDIAVRLTPARVMRRQVLSVVDTPRSEGAW